MWDTWNIRVCSHSVSDCPCGNKLVQVGRLSKLLIELIFMKCKCSGVQFLRLSFQLRCDTCFWIVPMSKTPFMVCAVLDNSCREGDGKEPITFQEFCLPFPHRFNSERRTNLRIVYSITEGGHLPIPYNIILRSSLCLKDGDPLICALTKRGMIFLYFMVSRCLLSIYYWWS